MTRIPFSYLTPVLCSLLALSACATKQPQATAEPDFISTESKLLREPGHVAQLDCIALETKYIALKEEVDAADVKPASIDFTDPMQLKNVKDLKGSQMASSVAKTAFLNSVPGAKLFPMLTGSTKKAAKRQDTVASGISSLDYLEGAIAAKNCPLPQIIVQARLDAAAEAEANMSLQEKMQKKAEAKAAEAKEAATAEMAESLSADDQAPNALGAMELKAHYDELKGQYDEVKDAVDEVEDFKEKVSGDKDEQTPPATDGDS